MKNNRQGCNPRQGCSPLYAVILAGGIGSRFWPLSRETTPKQLLKVVGDESLLNATIRRLSPLIPPERVFVVTGALQAELIRLHLCYGSASGRGAAPLKPDYGTEPLTALKPGYIIEPMGRDTAPAIGLAAMELYEKDPEAVMAILPADHVIGDAKPFRAALCAAAKAAKQGRLVTFGIVPTRPETGYGYIKAAKKKGASPAPGKIDGFSIFGVERFKEKPDVKTARRYIRQGCNPAGGGYYWNSGIFLWKAGRILEEIKRHLPALHKALCRIRDGADIREVYEKISAVSIDRGILEKAEDVVVIPANFRWSDMGSWSSFEEVIPADGQGNIKKGRVVDIGSSNSLIFGCDRVVATIGLKDMILVDTPDATLVCPKDRAQEVKDLVAILKKSGAAEHRLHRTVDRPWGSYTLLETGRGYKIKKICVLPRRRLSLQMHRHRSEHWVVIAGKARVQKHGKAVDVAVNESTYIPRGVKHRLENTGSAMLEIIEVQSGEYVEEDDIIRFKDDFERS